MSDRDRIASLVKRGILKRHEGDFERAHPEVAKPFVADIERRVQAMARGADTIRPNKKRKKKGRRR